MSETAITISLFALVAVIGLWIGHFKIKGVGLGIGACYLVVFCSPFYYPIWH